MSYKYEGQKSIPTKYTLMRDQGKPSYQPYCTQSSEQRTTFDILQNRRTMPHYQEQDHYQRAHGLAHFSPDDPVYGPIGGRPKGITWL